MRREFPAKVKVAAYERAAGYCEKCPARLSIGKFHYDHRIPDAMGGEPTLENCDVLCVGCHAQKSAVDAGTLAKAERQRQKHLGIKKAPTFWRPPGKYDWKGRRYVRTD